MVEGCDIEIRRVGQEDWQASAFDRVTPHRFPHTLTYVMYRLL